MPLAIIGVFKTSNPIHYWLRLASLDIVLAILISGPLCLASLEFYSSTASATNAKEQRWSTFGTPLFEWVKAYAKQESATVTVSKAVLPTEGRVPAHAEWVFTKGSQTRTWRVVEAWWAESFAMRPFRELAHWSYSILPWTFGAHFGRRLWRSLQAPKVGPWALVKWCAGVAAAFLELLAGLALSLLLFVVFWVLLAVSLIPWQRLRTGIQRIQIRLASTIGDCFVLVDRPIESAAIITRFQRELGWLKDCDRVAVVAHSQGGAVAALALGDQLPKRVKLLLTFGSGLRKLHDLTDLQASRSFRRGALLPVACGLLVLAALVVRDDPRGFDLGGTAAVLAWVAVGLAVLSGGVNDFIRVPDSKNLRALARRFKDRGVRWEHFCVSRSGAQWPTPRGRNDSAEVDRDNQLRVALPQQFSFCGAAGSAGWCEASSLQRQEQEFTCSLPV